MQTVLEGLWEEIVAQGDALKGKRVHVIVSEAEEPPIGSLERLFQTLDKIHAELQHAGHIPPTDKEAFERIDAERRSWDDQR